MAMAKLSILLAGAAGVSAYVPAPFGSYLNGQQPLASGSLAASRFQCDLPPVLDPSHDGLPSADELFSSKKAFETQVKRHQAIVRVPSICYDDLGSFDEDDRWEPFYTLHDVLEKTYPTVYKRAEVEKINRFGLLYTIQGSDESLQPILFMAHQDVVPVADESTWTHPPFEAFYDGEYIWGRGASDDKNSLTGLLSVVETLLSNDTWTPKRTILLGFGFDEECSGYRGAQKIANRLVERYGKDSLSIILDEGGLGIVQVDNALYVLPAVTEKGHVDIWFELDVVGGHSSIPFPHTGIGIISEIVTTLEAHPYKAEVIEGGPVHNHLMCQARYSPDAFPDLTKMVEEDDLEGLAHYLVRSSLPTQYMIQTSQAVDFIAGGQKINAMPEKTSLGVNYRVAHHNTIAEVQHNVVKYIRDIVAKYGLKVKAFENDDEYQQYIAGLGGDKMHSEAEVDYKGTLTLTSKEKSHASPISPVTGPAWDLFSGSIQHAFALEDVTVVPVGQLMTGNTDTRHYLDLSRNVYRFTPNKKAATDNIHTIDERVNMNNHMEMIKFYYELIRNADAAKI